MITEAVGSRAAICSVVAMPSMPGMLMSMSTIAGCRRCGQLQRLRSGSGRAHHLDVALESEQLRQVVAGLLDVVDDEDCDAIGHQCSCFVSVATAGLKVVGSMDGVE